MQQMCSTGGRWTCLWLYFSLRLCSSAHGGFGSPALEHCLLWAWWKLICCVDIEKEERQEETRNSSSLPFVKLVMIFLHWPRPLKTLMAYSWLHVQCLCHTGLGHGLLNTWLKLLTKCPACVRPTSVYWQGVRFGVAVLHSSIAIYISA